VQAFKNFLIREQLHGHSNLFTTMGRLPAISDRPI